MRGLDVAGPPEMQVFVLSIIRRYLLQLFDARIHQRTHHDRARARTLSLSLLYVLRTTNCPFHIIS